MAIGNILDGGDQQYVAIKDATGTWRVLNTWHNDLKLLDADSDIPDDSEAITILSEGQFIALIKEAGSQGVLSNATFNNNNEELENELTEVCNERDQLKEELEKANSIQSKPKRSEKYDLKEKAMDSILKLVSMQDMADLSKE
tara:strand:+ start:4369 stop:4797 length:429 start_codon:yes stop_codon:yes gene_type:complete